MAIFHKKIIICIVIISCTLFIKSENVKCAEYLTLELGVKESEFGYQSDMIKEFVKNKIPFHIDAEGILKYSGKNKEEVVKITTILDNRPAMHFKKKKYASLFILLLQKKGVSFLIRYGKQHNDIHIIWCEQDSAVVNNIIDSDFKQAVLESKKTGILGTYLYQPR